MSSPLITIAIPVYNEEKYLATTIESALNQTYKNVRIIISDNCSTDGSYKIASSFAAKDNRIELFRQNKNIGAIDNFKYPLSVATTKYFVWLGAHDVITKNYIEDAVKDLEDDKNKVLAYPAGETIDDKGKFVSAIEDDYDTTGIKKIEDRMLKIARNMYNGYVIHGVFKTEVLKKVPFENVTSTDFQVVMLTTSYGTISRLPNVGFQRRIVRKENYAEQTERHIEYGMFKKRNINQFSLLVLHLIKNILKIEQLPFFRKVLLILKIKKVFTQRFKVNWKEIIQLSFTG